jgi:hypothetical protein
MSFVFGLGSHPNIFHSVYAKIPKYEKNPKSETLLVLSILDKGYSPFTRMQASSSFSLQS